MKANEKICISIIKNQGNRPNGEYKEKILKACEMSKKLGYKSSPYELFWLDGITIK